MWYRRTLRFAVIAAILGMVASLTLSAQSSSRRGRKYKAPPPTSRVEVTVLRSNDGKPIENASVIFHMVGDKGNMELKSNEDGKSTIDVLPTGSDVLLQVIAKGYQTYGREYTLDKTEMSIEVKMNRPGEQYSIYKDQSKTADAGKAADKGAAQKDAEKDKPADSAKPQSAPSGTSPQQ